MPSSTFLKNFRDGTLVLKDGTGTPIQVTASLRNGDVALQGLAADLYEVNPYQIRGELQTLRKTNRTFPSGSFTSGFAAFTSATANNIVDAIRKAGAFAAAISTNAAAGDVYCLDMVLTIEGTDFSDSTDHTITATKCRFTVDFAEGDPDTVSVSFVCYGTITVT